MKNIKKVNRILLLIFLFALLLRVLFFLFLTPWNNSNLNNKIMPMGTDQRGYHQLALVFQETGKIAFKPDLTPTPLRTPLYPLFISAIYTLFGQMPWVVILFQNFFDSLTAIFLVSIFTSIFNNKTGIVSGILYALEPHIIFYANSYYSDTTFVFSLVIFLFFFVKYFSCSGKKISNLFFAGLFLGIAVLIKPAATYLPLLVILLIIFNLRKTLLNGLKFSGIFLVSYMLIISPWLIRNYIIYGSFFLTNSGEYNLLAINITPMEIPKRNKPQHIVEKELRMEADSLMYSEGITPHWNQKPKNYWDSLNLKFDYNKTKFWQKVAIKYIKENPYDFIRFYFLGIIHTLFNLNTTSIAENLNLIKTGNKLNLKTNLNLFELIKNFLIQKSLAEIFIGISVLIYTLIVYLGFILGFLKSFKASNRFLIFSCILFAIYFILIAGAGGLARFKMPAVPFYIGISAYGLGIILSRIKNFMLSIIGKKSI